MREFLDGCGWALEQFHRMKVDVVTRSMNAEDAGRRDSDGADKVGEDSDDLKIRPDVDLNFLQAASDPDSLDYAFMSMITPEMLDTIKMERILHVVTGNTAVVIDAAQSLKLVVPDGLKAFQSKDGKMRIVKEDTRVGKVALLGARVEEIYPPLEPNAHAEEGGSGPPSDGNVFKRHLGEMDRQLKEAKQERAELLDEPMEDDSLAASRNDGDEDAAQIVTQLEVLYELQQSAINDDGKTHTQTSVMVGKFEACVDGDPNGDEIQWRLCSYRPAVEFGYFNSW